MRGLLNPIRLFPLLTVMLIGLGLPGCGDDERDDEIEVRRERAVEYEIDDDRDDGDRTVIVERRSAAPRREIIVVQEAPPPVIVERVQRLPRGHVWIPGYHRHDGHRYVWVRGHSAPVRAGYRYEPARWTRSSRGWQFHAGVWIR